MNTSIHQNTRVLGIVGGIGSGKSTVAQLFVREGCALFDADRTGHDILLEPAVKLALQNRFGFGIFSPDENGVVQVDRKKLAAVVFPADEQSQANLDFLNNLVHPRILDRFTQFRKLCEERNIPFLIFDAPLLFENHLDTLCDEIIFVAADEKNRRERVKKRDWTDQELQTRENSQLSLQEKQKKSTCIIDNNSTYERIECEVKKLIQQFSR